MPIFLITDFGSTDIYVGQVKAVLAQQAPGTTVIDLLHEAPVFNAKASAHLLAALARRLPSGSITVAVVDPGVGSERDAVAVNVDGRWFIGPDNGLLSVVAARGSHVTAWRITWQPDELAPSFHGRDLFAPVAAAMARNEFPAGKAVKAESLNVDLGCDDLEEIIYIDHYGNAMTGLRAEVVAKTTAIVVNNVRFKHARVFSAVPPGESFWYENSLGLIEIAANGTDAARKFNFAVGQPVGYTA
jgi:S-adenosylmethionine hydrolase